MNLSLQSNGEDMQMIFIRASCDSGGDDYGYWFLSALALSCTLGCLYHRHIIAHVVTAAFPSSSD